MHFGKTIGLLFSTIFACASFGLDTSESTPQSNTFSWFTGLRVGPSYLDGSMKPRLDAQYDYRAHISTKKAGIEGEVFLGVQKELAHYYWTGEIGFSLDNIKITKSRFLMPSNREGFESSNLYYTLHRQGSGFLGFGVGTTLTENINLGLKFKLLLSRFKISFKHLEIDYVYGHKNTYEFGFAPGIQLSYRLSPRVSLDLNYTYTMYPTLKAPDLFHSPVPGQHIIYSTKANPQYHSVLVGVTYRF